MLEITLIHTVDIEENRKRKKRNKKFCKNFVLDFGITFSIILFK